MTRLTHAALLATLLASACKVERTPPEYIDHRQPLSELRSAATEELQDRLLAMGQALNRGDGGEALRALSPALDAYAFSSDRATLLDGVEQISAALGDFAALPGRVELSDLRVTVGPTGNVAWFRVRIQRSEPVGRPPFRLTGVYLRGDEGEWRLVQAHLSAATLPPDSVPADSLPPSPDAGAAPLAGE